MSDAAPEPKSLTCIWEVVAGLVPGQPDPEFTKRFPVSRSDYPGRDEFTDAFIIAGDQAHAYAKELTDPSRLNWVRVDWIWV